MLCIFLKILLFLWFRCPFVIFNLPIWKRFCTVARICNTQINISAHKQMFQNTSQNIISLKSISIHHRELFNTQRDIPNTQQSLTHSRWHNKMLFDTQQKIACGNFRDYGEFSWISLYWPVYHSELPVWLFLSQISRIWLVFTRFGLEKFHLAYNYFLAYFWLFF